MVLPLFVSILLQPQCDPYGTSPYPWYRRGMEHFHADSMQGMQQKSLPKEAFLFHRCCLKAGQELQRQAPAAMPLLTG